MTPNLSKILIHLYVQISFIFISLLLDDNKITIQSWFKLVDGEKNWGNQIHFWKTGEGVFFSYENKVGMLLSTNWAWGGSPVGLSGASLHGKMRGLRLHSNIFCSHISCAILRSKLIITFFLTSYISLTVIAFIAGQ